MRLLVFVLFASLVTAYAFWVYLRVELRVPVARALAVVRASALVLVLLLLFDPRIPAPGAGVAPARWALLDASVSMVARGTDGASAWESALARAEALEGEGWRIVRFGGERLDVDDGEGDGPESTGFEARDSAVPDVPTTRLLPALEAAAEAGVRRVRVLSDMRFEDAVAVRGAAGSLPLEVTFEPFGASTGNRGISRFEVADVPRPDVGPLAEVEVHGGAPGDSIDVEIFEEERPVARVRFPAPAAGLRATREVELPPAEGGGRMRYTARLAAVETGAGAAVADDGFEADDFAVAYATVGFEEGGLVLVSFAPDWEVRHLLPVLEDVTGLPGSAYLRAGPDRYVRGGVAADRGPAADSATVRRAATGAALLVLHGLGASSEAWAATLAARPGRRLMLPSDPVGARALGLEVAAARPGEWYASPDVPTSPVAGALAGVELQELPPVTSVMVADPPDPRPVLQLQLRGAGAPQGAFRLVDDPSGRLVVGLATGWWRWAARDEGRGAYRSLFSGLAGWLLGGERAAAADPRPASWVFPAGQAIAWSMPPGDSTAYRVVVGSEPALDTLLTAGAPASLPALAPGTWPYAVLDEEGDTVGSGRFDVVRSTPDMIPPPVTTDFAALGGADAVPVEAAGRPLRTSPLPYLLIIALLCGEWIVRRRSGLR